VPAQDARRRAMIGPMLARSQPLVAVEGFSGPFDLLVRLIERRELSLLAISLAEVTDQYLASLTASNLRDPEHLSAFLVVAAKLLLIKSTLLLPARERPPMPAGDAADPSDLTERLGVYRAFRSVADVLGARHDAGLRSYPHVPATYRPSKARSKQPLDPALVVDAYSRAIGRSKQEAVTVPLPLETRLTVAEALALVREALARFQTLQFTDLVGDDTSRQRYVATFLAVLELARLEVVSVQQAQRYGEISLTKRTPTRIVDEEDTVATK
jgi:segregation and condensation protein A